jgi:hypothetical protein
MGLESESSFIGFRSSMQFTSASDPERRYGRAYNFVWCADFYRHRPTSTTTSTE